MTGDTRIHRLMVQSVAAARPRFNFGPTASPAPAQVPSGAIRIEIDETKPPAPNSFQVPPSAIARENDQTKPSPPSVKVPSSAIASENERTKPPLSDQQRAVARLLVMGFRPVEIARALGLNHHTIPRWRRDARVQLEMSRLRAHLDGLLASRRALIQEYAKIHRDVRSNE